MEIYTKEELEPLFELVKQLQRDVAELKETQTVWVDQEEAERLTGRSRSWFYTNRHHLPIAIMPRTNGSKRNKYSKADCIKYGRDHQILPPSTLSPIS